MKLQLRSIIGPGDLKTERITFRATTDLDLGDYTVLQAAYIEGTLTTHIYESFWFPYQAVSKGDLIILYTRDGSARQKPLEKGGVAHFFYWDLSAPIWADEERGAVLIYSPEWEAKSVSELTQKVQSKPTRRISLD